MQPAFSIGCDPEVFLREKKSSKLVSAAGLIPGSKTTPYPVMGGAIQVDGMAAEFNTLPVPLVDDGFKTFDDGIQTVIKELKSAVGAHHSLVMEPVAEFGLDYIHQQPAEVQELGCDPDYNAYTLQQNPRPDGELPFRTAAGHIHVGWGSDIPVDDPEHVKICASFVKFLDVTVGLYMTLIEEPNQRRDLYGKAGAFRPKSYGVEYRTPSCVWLRNRLRRRVIFELCQRAVKLRKNNSRLSFIDDEELQEIINTGDKGRALSYLRDFSAGYETWVAINDLLIEA